MIRAAFLCLVLAACATPGRPPSLDGTTWRLVRFVGGDGKVLAPADPSHYTLAFGAKGALSARIDCNRARGSWKSAGPGRLELGPSMAVTRAMCAPDSLHDDVLKRLPYVRSYVLKDGRLFLSMQADGGVFEMEPAP